ncbi:multicopper oxidase family protein [Paludibacterium denitrificans]|uniref:multicopper oxidase family protein n=1 Tax=Paludibacterium denitrificans TaxID=2675226 RepID=UPI001E611E22|nr:multicopper oxidase domain-containing protein [Paludibacterium denitrificans]
MDRRHFLQFAATLTASTCWARQSWAQGMDHHAMSGAAAGTAAVPLGRTLSLAAPAAAQCLAAPCQSGGRRTLCRQLARRAGTTAAGTGPPRYDVLGLQRPVPGPAIVAQEGDSVALHFANQLAQPTTIHWHGLPVPPAQDGNPHDPVLPGQQRDYRFTLPQGSAGTYWYHPHPHGLTGQQAYMGLAGVFVVKAKDDPLASLPEQWLVLSDLKLAENGQIAANSMADRHDGREGQFVLVNAGLQPVLTLAAGERQRWRLWNATNARILKLALLKRMKCIWWAPAEACWPRLGGSTASCSRRANAWKSW